MSRRLARIALLAPLVALAGCAEALPAAAVAVCATPAELHVTLASGDFLNPDESGAPLPTEVRVLELRDAAPLESASFEDTWVAASPLAESIASTTSVTLYPGETATVDVHPGAEILALALVAIVRQPAGRTWRVVVPLEGLPCGASATLPLRVDEYRIERATEAPAP